MGKLQELQGRPRDPFQAYLTINRPDLRVPEQDIVMIAGCQGWSPADETPGPDCPKCRGQIKPGSLLYCPRCGLSGHEVKLAEQRRLAPPPRRARPCRIKPVRVPKSRPPGTRKPRGVKRHAVFP